MKSTLLKTALLALACSAPVWSGEAQAQIFVVLHSFAGGDDDGANPYGGVAPGAHGGFYVATDAGGLQNSGTLVFISKKGTATVVHGFAGNSDGQNADGTPFVDFHRTVYGTTRYGGAQGCGTLYRYSPSDGYAQQDNFSCGSNNELAFPFAGLTASALLPPFIGTATNGNAGNGGDDGGFYTLVNNNAVPACQFHGSDGSQPYGGVIEVKLQQDYEYYIAASAGGTFNLGTVTLFELGCNVRVLHNFAGGSDGATPYGTLLYNNDFFLYGTTRYGGTNNLGTVFRVDISGGNYTVLHTFQGICCGNSDGSFPASGLTLNPKDGMYYGTTINGGGSSDDGTIYRIDPDTGVETVVHAFTGADGAHPYASPYIDEKGRIYGTTLQGGAHNLGVVFRLKT